MGMIKSGLLTLLALAVVGAAIVQLAPGPAREAATAAGATGGGGAATPAGAPGEVRMKDLQFAPKELRVEVGATVTWINDDPMGHTVTPTDKALWGSEGSGDAPDAWLQKGGSWSFTFAKPGTYKYYCLPHASRGSDGEYVGMVGVVIVGGGSGGSGAPAFQMPAATVVPSPVAPPRSLPGPDGKVRLELETREVVAQLADGTAYTFWTFNGTVPGPMLRVREGDTVELTLRNAADSANPHSIDLHSVTGPGGGAAVTQTQPGGSTTFTWKALNPGLYVYHCATPHIPTHVAQGMYGLILVEPEEGLPPVDREFYVVQGEIYTQGKVGEGGLQGISLEKLQNEDPEYFLLNGRVGALTGEGALKASVGETVRIYFGVGGAVPSSFHVIGEVFDAVYMDANGPATTNRQTVMVPAAGAAMIDFRVDYPGTYVLVDHTLTRTLDRGAAGLLVVEGSADHAIFHGSETEGSGH